MRRGLQSLRQRDRQFVVDPAVLRIPLPRVRILGGDADIVRAVDMLEILEPPGIGFADRHRPVSRSAPAAAAAAGWPATSVVSKSRSTASSAISTSATASICLPSRKRAPESPVICRISGEEPPVPQHRVALLAAECRQHDQPSFVRVVGGQQPVDHPPGHQRHVAQADQRRRALLRHRGDAGLQAGRQPLGIVRGMDVAHRPAAQRVLDLLRLMPGHHQHRPGIGRQHVVHHAGDHRLAGAVGDQQLVVRRHAPRPAGRQHHCGDGRRAARGGAGAAAWPAPSRAAAAGCRSPSAARRRPCP